MERLFKGANAIVLTPFTEDAKVDKNLLEKYVARAVDSGCLDGIIMCGSTGEFSRLSFEENVEIMKIAQDVCRGRTKFICGATAGDSYTACRYVEQIGKLNADGILIAPPYYFTLTDEEVLEYYKSVINANDANVPIIGYNIPQCTNPLSVNVFKELLKYNCVKGFKNSWNDMQQITEEIAIRDEKRPDVSMLTGLDACLYGTLSLGGDGVFSAIAYLMPEVSDFIIKNHGKYDKAFKCQADLIKLINVVNRFTFPFGYRVLSDALGCPLGVGREEIPPTMALSVERAKQEMKDIYKDIITKYLI